jgi:parallel beta-helix repeat protein
VQDSVQGGGLRLEETTASTVATSRFARNWNGIELRSSHQNVVRGNIADHCSNTGATLAHSDRNRIEDNDLSWGIRGANLSFPNRWYGVDTKDSAGIIVDAESSRNQILGNNLTYGGDGVFIRSIIGGCATDNLVQGNDTSFSPHNAIECWCDGNQFIDNLANDSDYGIWLGGTDRGLVRGNRVERNRTDGISIQIGEDRHTVIEENIVTDNGRTGILLTGREIQSWHPLTHVGPNLADSSHLVVQRNTFSGNGPCAPFSACDVFVTASRGVLLASNCSEGNTTTAATTGQEAEGIWSVGGCGAPATNRPPLAALAPVSGLMGQDVTLDGSASMDPDGQALAHYWVVQRAGPRFNPPQLPPALLLGSGGPSPTVRFPSPGLWSVSLTVHDALDAAIAWRTAAIAPSGRAVGAAAADWTYRCTTAGCATHFVDDSGLLGTAVRMDTDEAFPFAMITPAAGTLALDASSFTRLGGFFRAENRNMFGWQGNFPTFVLHSSGGGTITYAPSSNLLPTGPDEWIWVDLPLAGGSGWTRTDAGGALADVARLEIQLDTWDYGRYDLWVDALTFY